ncbi:alpha/beta-hydrolase [Aspergillus ellipticus CBS 707.79]|uniref:Alpha/beta-hydrolase n=1 Tax=Aspergillus ellipticus CBS 707.79 TaxID=1448320 RepID=A0A319D1S4_9EURO|nr:alpha/beta-hydrolase [Aspergillus ellipticus CBS 707.79]
MASYPPAKTFVYKVDPSGHQIECDVHMPENITKPAPVIIWLHYSGMIAENRHVVGTSIIYSSTKRGYILVIPDYRLAPQAKIDEIYSDVEDCAKWVRTVLPKALGEGVVDTSRLVVGGGSCGGQLALTTGLYLNPPPVAVISLYALTDPTDADYNTPTKPNPPCARDTLISWAEVEPYMGPNAPMESHPENGCDLPKLILTKRALVYGYVLQEGIYLPTVYGEMSVEDIRAKWVIAPNITSRFPPTFVSHGGGDRYVPASQSEAVVQALQKAGVEHVWYHVPGYDHGFDVYDMHAGEEGALDKEFAAKLWPWLEKVVRGGEGGVGC